MKIIITTKNYLDADLFKAKKVYSIKTKEFESKMKSKKSFTIGDNIYIFEAIRTDEQPYSRNVVEFVKLLQNELPVQEKEKWYLILHAKDVGQIESFDYHTYSGNIEVILYDGSSAYLRELFFRDASEVNTAEQIIETFFLFRREFYEDFTRKEEFIRDNKNENASQLVENFKNLVFSKARSVNNASLLELLERALNRPECKDIDVFCDTIYDLREVNLYMYES